MFEKIIKWVNENKKISPESKKKINERFEKMRQVMGQQKDLNNP